MFFAMLILLGSQNLMWISVRYFVSHYQNLGLQDKTRMTIHRQREATRIKLHLSFLYLV